MSQSDIRWLVELRSDACSLCELCARHCPTGALRIQKADGRISLWFESATCHGCPGATSCVKACPEDTVRLRQVPRDGDFGNALLITSELAKCSYCNADFAPVNKLDRLAHKGQTSHELIRDLCPLCRRTQLVVSFIKEHRDPEGNAEYRSTKAILRRLESRDVKIIDEDPS